MVNLLQICMALNHYDNDRKAMRQREDVTVHYVCTVTVNVFRLWILTNLHAKLCQNQLQYRQSLYCNMITYNGLR